MQRSSKGPLSGADTVTVFRNDEHAPPRWGLLSGGRRLIVGVLVCGGLLTGVASAREAVNPEPPDVEAELRAAMSELSNLRETIAAEKIPLTKELAAQERALSEVRATYNDVKRQLDRRNLDMNNVRKEIKTRKEEKTYLSNLLGEYIRNLESRLHISELRRYTPEIEAAKLAPENRELTPAQVFAEQTLLVESSVSRLVSLLGGTTFRGKATGADGIMKHGTFVLFGPMAYFASDDGTLVGMAEQRLGSLEPTVAGYANPAFLDMTREFVENNRGMLPLDASLGNARKVEETRETLGEHIEKGGFMMYPIIAVAVVTFVYGLIKLFRLGTIWVRLPSGRKLRVLNESAQRGDREAATAAAKNIGGPMGRMLKAGAALLGEKRDLIEEAMFEVMLEQRYRMRGLVPFVAVTAAAAPLMGLLGTVLGIINTFKMLTVFGSGDVKQLSGGISEALITTEAGLVLAIPALTFHAILTWLIKGYADSMEKSAVAFLKHVPSSGEKES